jgi:membrane-associated phospholipid phosphatase
MATREPTTRILTTIHPATSRLPRPRRLVIVVPLLAFAIAFGVDVATGRRFSQALGCLALLASAGVVPAVRRAALPVAAYAGVWVGFNALRAVADDAGLGLVSRRAVSELEASMFGAELPSAMAQRSVLAPTQVGVPQLAVTAVYLSFFVVPHIVAAVLLMRNRYLFRKAVVALVLLFGAGVVAFAVAPTDPPWLAASKEPSLGDVQRLPRYVLGELGVQFGYATDGEQGYGFEPNPLASMPSIHLGATVLIGAIAWQSRSSWRWMACAYAVAMGIALVASGEHYVLDVLAGALLAMAAWALAGRVLERSASAPVRGARGQPDPRRVPSARLSTDQSFGRGIEPRSALPRATGAGDPAGRGV